MKAIQKQFVVITVAAALFSSTSFAQTTTPTDTAVPALTSQCSGGTSGISTQGTILAVAGGAFIAYCAAVCTAQLHAGGCIKPPSAAVPCGLAYTVGAGAIFFGMSMKKKASNAQNQCNQDLAAIQANNPTGTASTQATTPAGGDSSTGGTGTTGGLPAGVEQQLKAAGIQFDPATGTGKLPNGTPITPSSIKAAMSSPEGQAAMAGITADANKMAAAAVNPGIENDTGGTGTALSGGKSASGGNSGGLGSDVSGASGGKVAGRQLANASGTTKVTASGDVIGGAQDNIFAMVNRRFNSESQQGHNLLPVAPSPSGPPNP